MKYTRKGYTLVEVLVSIVVFTILVLSLFSTYFGLHKMVHRQEEYTRLEMVAHDINYYWDMYGTGWESFYFNKESDNLTIIRYLNEDFEPGSNINEPYEVLVNYSLTNELLITIKSNIDGRVYIQNVNCGTSALHATQEAQDEETP